MGDYIVNEGEVLIKVQQGAVKKFLINVEETLSGKHKGDFTARPNLLVMEARGKYFGHGKSETEALNDCLARIKGVPFDKVIEGYPLSEK
jgi:hypothetical protein